MTETADEPRDWEAPHVATLNHAVARCQSAWDRVYKTLSAKGADSPSMYADRAFRKAMPPLSGYENIRDFIACVAQGLIIGAIREDTGSKLLYAAQVALGAFRQQPAPKKSDAA